MSEEINTLMLKPVPQNAEDVDFHIQGNRCRDFKIIRNDEKKEPCTSCHNKSKDVLAKIRIDDELTLYYCVDCLQSTVYSMFFELSRIYDEKKVKKDDRKR